MVKEVKRNYYLNLFSGNAEITKNSIGTKNSIFKWNIRDLQLGSEAEIGLVQIASVNFNDYITSNTNITSTINTNTTNIINTYTPTTKDSLYAIRCLETYADGYDSYNQTSAILYLGLGLNQIINPTFHKLISNNLNSITLVTTDDITNSSAVYNGIDTNIKFGVILQVIDYIDENQKF